MFDIVRSHQNLKSRIQAANALLCYNSLNQMGGDKIILKAWESLSSSLQLGSGTVGTVAEQRYVHQIEVLSLELWVKVAT